MARFVPIIMPKIACDSFTCMQAPASLELQMGHVDGLLEDANEEEEEQEGGEEATSLRF